MRRSLPRADGRAPTDEPAGRRRGRAPGSRLGLAACRTPRDPDHGHVHRGTSAPPIRRPADPHGPIDGGTVARPAAPRWPHPPVPRTVARLPSSATAARPSAPGWRLPRQSSSGDRAHVDPGGQDRTTPVSAARYSDPGAVSADPSVCGARFLRDVQHVPVRALCAGKPKCVKGNRGNPQVVPGLLRPSPSRPPVTHRQPDRRPAPDAHLTAPERRPARAQGASGPVSTPWTRRRSDGSPGRS
jgi:hypothetical protein